MSVKNVYDAILDFDSDMVVKHVKEELAAGTDINSVLNDGLISAMDEVGRKFNSGEFFVPEMLIAAQAMKAGLDELKPFLVKGSTTMRGTIVIGTVKGDLHDIGKNMVAMIMEGAGFEIIDVGMDVPPEKFIAAVKEHNAQIMGMSALLTTTMPAMKQTIELLKEEGLAGKVKTMIGGAPVTQAFADSIGADAYCEDAPAAVENARKLLG
jgi:5-methyltetrahydrofolate--homocysteine methyltransferase